MLFFGEMTTPEDVKAAEDAWEATVSRFLNSRVKSRGNALTTLAGHFASYREEVERRMRQPNTEMERTFIHFEE